MSHHAFRGRARRLNRSIAWLAITRQKLAIDSTCAICGGEADEVHDPGGCLGKDDAEMDDLVPVCAGCHWTLGCTRHRNGPTIRATFDALGLGPLESVDSGND